MLRRFAVYWLPLLLWMSVIFSASTSLGTPAHTSRFIRPFLLWLNPHMSEETIHTVHYCIRKTAHAVEYAILGILIWRLIRTSTRLSNEIPARQIRLAILLAALYAATDEGHQVFVPGREPAIHDVALDTCGATAGIFGARLIMLKRKST